MERMPIKKVERKAIVSDCLPDIYKKPDLSGINCIKVSEYMCETHCNCDGVVMNIITSDILRHFYLYDCLTPIPVKISKADSPLRLKGRRI